MKKYILISILTLGACAKQNPTVDNSLEIKAKDVVSKEEMEISKNRSKNLNNLERLQIEDWIKSQTKPYFPMGLNYWVDVEGFYQNARKTDGEVISYQYDIYDFDMVKLYNDPIVNQNVVFGRFDELRPVEDALRYIKKDQEVTLLIPSALAFGTYGDNKKISNDMPIIIKLKLK